jgi:putative ABC transport system ATP-binding protein
MDLLHQVVLKNGIMLLIVTHDLDIAKTCNTIFEMDGGRLQCVKYDS